MVDYSQLRYMTRHRLIELIMELFYKMKDLNKIDISESDLKSKIEKSSFHDLIGLVMNYNNLIENA